MIDILDCTLKKAVELASHFLDADTTIEIFRDGCFMGTKTLKDLEEHSGIYDCMSDDYGFIERVKLYNYALAVFIHSY